jgi:hypothetical protein
MSSPVSIRGTRGDYCARPVGMIVDAREPAERSV